MTQRRLAPIPTAAPCTKAEHDAIKSAAVRFLDGTEPIGIMANGASGLFLANCRRCGSTLARPMPPPSGLEATPPRETAEAAAKLGLTPDQLAVALGVCPRCTGYLVDGVCEPCGRQRSGERCCHNASRFSCFCEVAWHCIQHGTTHRGSHD